VRDRGDCPMNLLRLALKMLLLLLLLASSLKQLDEAA
jgi:hypothetical protein